MAVSERNTPSKQKGAGRGRPVLEVHKTVPRWMRIQWARATGLLAAWCGINTG